MGKVLYVITPAGHGGAGSKTWETFRQSWFRPIAPDDIVVTQRPGHAREIAASASGYETIAAVGGDGTGGEIMSATIDGGKHVNEPDVAYFPATNVEIDSDSPAIIELDGDLCGWTPATITVCPKALQCLTPVVEGE